MVDRDKLRTYLDALDDEELIRMRDALDEAPEDSKHEINGVTVPKREALLLVNQAIVMDNS